MTRTYRRGRPLGAVARAVLEVVRTEPVTVTALTARLQLSYAHAVSTVSRLHAAGYVQYGGAVPGRHDRPARLIEPAPPQPTHTAHAHLPWPQ